LASADFDPDVVGCIGQFFEDAVLPGGIIEEVLAQFLAGHGMGSLANLRQSIPPADGHRQNLPRDANREIAVPRTTSIVDVAALYIVIYSYEHIRTIAADVRFIETKCCCSIGKREG